MAFCSVPCRHRGHGLFSIVFLASAFRWLLSPLHLYFSSLAACRWPFQAQSSLFLQEIPFNSFRLLPPLSPRAPPGSMDLDHIPSILVI